MQAIMEPIFHVVYLTLVTGLGLYMLMNAKGDRYFKWFGVMAITLGFGDAFHLIPRIIALRTTGFDAHVEALGFGKFMTSITMTLFYLMLYSLWKQRYRVQGFQKMDLFMWTLAVIRIGLCFFPQNQWFSATPSLAWGIYRNVPFAIMGIVMIVLYFMKWVDLKDKDALKMSKAVTLSFAFYIPVVLWASENFWVGMLMIPKTMAYVWIVYIGFKQLKAR